jgi:cobalamin biosynthesis protein CobD/CbiB
LGEGGSSNRGSNALEHDLRRDAEVAKALAAGDVKAARKAANQIRGRKEQKAADLKIDEYIAAHETGEVTS